MNKPPEVTFWRSQGFWLEACDELARRKIGSWEELEAYMREVLTYEKGENLAAAVSDACFRYLFLEDREEARRRECADLAAIYSWYVLWILQV